jgi:hydrogenase expression/formation protein HypD
MKYLDEFRSPGASRSLVQQIRAIATRRWTIMEVCGGQTHGLLRFGIDEELRGVIDLLHGPGCPVCVTSLAAVDLACELSLRSDLLLATFGDMLRVPGSGGSLLQTRARGGMVQMVYSPLDAVRLASERREREVVFFAVGFETTAPATALAVKQAAARGLKNFSLLVSHVRVQPAMERLAADRDLRIDAFLAAGHVCTVTGYDSYHSFARRTGRPIAVTGFEPVDLLAGILACVEQLEGGRAEVANCYARSVAEGGNRSAQDLVARVYEVCDREWRGFGVVPEGGLRLRDEWRTFDAERRYGASLPPRVELADCRSGEILSGSLKPHECPAFGCRCTPDTPLGAPMVSSEGACAAYHRYASQRAAQEPA